MTEPENRKECRLDSEKAAVFVETRAEDPEQGNEAERILCRLLDVSASGIRIRIDQSLSVGTILRVAASFSTGEKPLSLVAEVRWVKEDGDYYQVGFSVFDSAMTDVAQWKKLVAQRI